MFLYRSRTLINIPHHEIKTACRPCCSSYLTMCTVNVRSLKNKTSNGVDYVSCSGADVFALAETWFRDIADSYRTEATPPGFRLLDCPRVGRTGEGTALLFHENMVVRKIAGGQSFEHSEWGTGLGSQSI